ncbi:DUF4913 domain-containing protein [Arthrobacter bambusae]|uniref:DUF4913 domain-containing protein n=1 Tax=Arthrobacter bambusae TaxID=1338426 RepID=UPI0027871B1B|nr:DUF4913 domain-containing protein [Arthrobacter bambusae]MDQ0241476.1 hypothetical protein [Arthrobacter bambusae]
MTDLKDAWDNERRPGTGSDLGDQRDGTGFVLTVTEVVALVAEHAQPVSANRWRSMVMAGETPAPLGWEPPRWDFTIVEAWIPQALESGVLQPLAKATSDQVPEPELFFGSTEQWVTRFLLPIYRRQLSDNGDKSTWCPEWWKHAEAVIRLEALWRAWEHLRLDGRTGMSVWLKDHLDHHLPVLTGSGGPFTNCTVKSHADDLVLLKQFPATAAPAEYFPDVRPPKTEATGK